MKPAPVGGWRRAVVDEVGHQHRDAVSLRLAVTDRIDHLPGQHYVVRLTAPDGSTAARSYSVVSAPTDPLLELYVERLDNGEVSTYLADVVEPGDELEVRGPIGGWFVWDGSVPALAVGGGSGVAPLISMLRHAADLGRPGLLKLAASARTLDRLPYADELVAAGTVLALTREGFGGRTARRLDSSDLAPLIGRSDTNHRATEGPSLGDPVVDGPAIDGPAVDRSVVDGPVIDRPAIDRPATDRPAIDRPINYVCGSAGFAETASSLLVGLGVPPATIRVERFGPSGS